MNMESEAFFAMVLILSILTIIFAGPWNHP